MRTAVAVVFLFVPVVLAEPPSIDIHSPAAIEWKEGPASLPKGAKIAILEGDPSKPGSFVFRVKLPDGYRVPPHTHPKVERITVISGTFNVGMGGVFDAEKTRAMPAGSYGFWPAGMEHFVWAKGETVLQFHGEGPWSIQYSKASDDPRNSLIANPSAFETLINPTCSHCQDEAKRRAKDLKNDDRVLCWTRGYSDGGAIPIRFFLAPHRVISDSYGVFVYDPDAGFARGFAPSYLFRFHGWRNGVMVMRHEDGTLYSCLSGIAFDGPKKGTRLKSLPTIVSNWGPRLQAYPHAVAYRMFEKYRPVDLPARSEPESVRSRGKADPRLPAEAEVLGVSVGSASRAYPIDNLSKDGLIVDEIGGDRLVILWDARTRTASAYRPSAFPPRKYKGPQPNEEGVSPPDEGVPDPPTATTRALKTVTLRLAAGTIKDQETGSSWDVEGRCLAGSLKGWTLEWVDSVQVKWFAWTADWPETRLYEKR
jgi:quercetin dioxygenase-like cupin family protein